MLFIDFFLILTKENKNENLLNMKQANKTFLDDMEITKSGCPWKDEVEGGKARILFLFYISVLFKLYNKCM